MGHINIYKLKSYCQRFEILNQPGAVCVCVCARELCSRSIHGLRRPRGDFLSIFGSPTASASVSTRANTLPRDQIWMKKRSNSSGTLGHSYRLPRCGWYGRGRGVYKRRGGRSTGTPSTGTRSGPSFLTDGQRRARGKRLVDGVRGTIWSSENLLGLKIMSTKEQSGAEPIPVLFLSNGFYFDTRQVSGSDLMR